MRVADFFCGGGGFSEGFRQAGFQIVFAVDKWEPAVTTYKGNKPGVNVVLDDVIRIASLPDEEFEQTVPDSEVIIGSPPCQAFSNSNKSGNADKSLGIRLIEAYLRVIARKKFKKNSVLKYWVLENVPNVQNYIKDTYTASDFGLEGNFELCAKGPSAGIYNAKYYGAPTNRKRYLCGEFPMPEKIYTDENVITLKAVLASLGEPLSGKPNRITDINYPDFSLPRNEVSDHLYVHELAPFEWEVAKRLKQDKGYMGKMAFPENLDKPSRTVMATMASGSRESMILGYGNGRFRLPTVREVASMMSFPIDYWFYGTSKGIKHTLVGNAVAPKMSYAIAKAIAIDSGKEIPKQYIPICHASDIPFFNLNGLNIPITKERPKRRSAKFKYHIPYLIVNSYRVELTNYNSDFLREEFNWCVEIHYSQGKARAAKFTPSIPESVIPMKYSIPIKEYLRKTRNKISTHNRFQELFCMTTEERRKSGMLGPYELLADVRAFLDDLVKAENRSDQVRIEESPGQLPLVILLGYHLLNEIVYEMGGQNDECRSPQRKTE